MPEDAVQDAIEAPEEVAAEPVEAEEAAPEVDAEGTEEAPEAEGDVEAEAEEGETDAVDVAVDGRKMPDSLKKVLAGIKASSPEEARRIKDMWFADREYRAAFAKPADAVAAKGLLEQIGGPDGLQSLQAERDEWNELDQKYGSGDPDFVKSIAESNPEAFLKIAPQALNEWASRAPDQYGYYANRVALNTLSGAGISTDVLARAHAAYADNPQAQSIIAEVHNALLGLNQKATEFEQKRLDPREEQLKAKETQFEERRRADFESGVDSKARTYLDEVMQPEIARVLAGKEVSEAKTKVHQRLVREEIEAQLAAMGKTFENQLEACYRSGDPQRSLDYIKTQYNRLLPAVVKKVIEPLERGAATPKPKPSTGSVADGKTAKPASPGTVIVKEMPDWSEFDQTRTTVADMIQGFGILKNGKRASGWA